MIADARGRRSVGKEREPAQPGEPGRRLRLGIDFHTFDGIYQGSRSHLLGLYGEAILQAPDIDFLFLLAEPDALRAAHPKFSRNNVRLITMPPRSGTWRLCWQLAAMQRRHRLDLLHVQFRLPFFPSGPCMCTMHDVLFETHPQYFSRSFGYIARWSARDAARRARILLTVSEYSRQQIALHYRLPAGGVVLTPNAVDRQRFHPRAGTPVAAADTFICAETKVHPDSDTRGGTDVDLNKPRTAASINNDIDPKANTGIGNTIDTCSEIAILQHWNLSSGGYICTLGRLEPRKNHANLVRAYARLPADAPPLVIIGQRDFAYAQVFDLIREYHLDKRVRILEDVDDAALPVVLRHACLMAYPSQAEGFGMPVLEALASGIPVIAGNDTSLPEVAGEAARLVAPADIDGLAAALRASLTESPDARQSRVQRGLAHAARFSWADSAASLLAAVRRATPACRT